MFRGDTLHRAPPRKNTAERQARYFLNRIWIWLRFLKYIFRHRLKKRLRAGLRGQQIHSIAPQPRKGNNAMMVSRLFVIASLFFSLTVANTTRGERSCSK
jgi:hypothetical protein